MLPYVQEVVLLYYRQYMGAGGGRMRGGQFLLVGVPPEVLIPMVGYIWLKSDPIVKALY